MRKGIECVSRMIKTRKKIQKMEIYADEEKKEVSIVGLPFAMQAIQSTLEKCKQNQESKQITSSNNSEIPSSLCLNRNQADFFQSLDFKISINSLLNSWTKSRIGYFESEGLNLVQADPVSIKNYELDRVPPGTPVSLLDVAAPNLRTFFRNQHVLIDPNPAITKVEGRVLSTSLSGKIFEVWHETWLMRDEKDPTKVIRSYTKVLFAEEDEAEEMRM